jgi:hypothetical protein
MREILLPLADLGLGAGVMLLIIIVHAAALRLVSDRFAKRTKALSGRREAWRADVLLGTTAAALLAVHLIEIMIWATTLLVTGLVRDGRTAIFFAANTYTTLGYGTFVLPLEWQMLAPIMAISGLFTFGWTGSVLVNLVAQYNVLRADHRQAHP